jgi:hypothetical protein
MRISNFNVLMSGVNLYQENINYNFLEFLNEVRTSNSLNGGLNLGISSGLISQSDWESGVYGYIYVDLSRRLSQATDDIARSIQVNYTNNSLQPLDLIWCVGYEREICLSTSTGALVI